MLSAASAFGLECASTAFVRDLEIFGNYRRGRQVLQQSVIVINMTRFVDPFAHFFQRQKNAFGTKIAERRKIRASFGPGDSEQNERSDDQREHFYVKYMGVENF